MQHRDTRFWLGLLIENVDPQRAIVIAKNIFDGEQILAANPLNRDGGRIRVEADFPRAYRHILFKAPNDTHNRQFPDSELLEHFQADRASRLHWIPETLLNPERVFWEPDRGGLAIMHFYSYRVREDEFFVVLVRQNGKRYELTTTYSFTAGEWHAKKSKLKLRYK
ncbi:MAG: hypothetical protein ACO1SV_08970 [Fimbriimonas sp.]